MKVSRIFLASLVLFVFVCSSLFALPSFGGSKKVSSDASPEPVAEEPQPIQVTPIESQEVQPVLVLPLASSSTTEQENISAQLSATLTDLETASRLNKKQLSELITDLELVQADIEVMQADAEEKRAHIAELEEANAKQADDLAYLQGRYDKETSLKKYFNLTALCGWEGDDLLYGLGGNVGLRTGKGLLIGVGCQYMLGKVDAIGFGDISDAVTDPHKSNLMVTASIGWEW